MRTQSKAFSNGIHCYCCCRCFAGLALPFGQPFLNEAKKKKNHFCANDLRSPKMVKCPMFYGADRRRWPNEHTKSNHRAYPGRCVSKMPMHFSVFMMCLRLVYWILDFNFFNDKYQSDVCACAVCTYVRRRLTGACIHLSAQHFVNWNIQRAPHK